jgi:hypothetical protein
MNSRINYANIYLRSVAMLVLIKQGVTTSEMWEFSNGTMFILATTEQDLFVVLMYDIESSASVAPGGFRRWNIHKERNCTSLNNWLTEYCRLLKCRKADHLQRRLEPYSSPVSVQTSYFSHVRTAFLLLLHATRAQPTLHVTHPVFL